MLPRSCYILALSTLCAAVPVQPAVVHEKRDLESYSPRIKGTRLEKDSILPMRVGLKQSNLDKAFDRLMEVSVLEQGCIKHIASAYLRLDHIPMLQIMETIGLKTRSSPISPHPKRASVLYSAG